AENPAAVMVFQDGAGYREYVPTVFDNLIAQGDMPVTVGIFIQPGVFEGGRANRSFEYDTLSDQYARFLLEEILPAVEADYALRRDAAGRGIGGRGRGGGGAVNTTASLIRRRPPKPIRVFLQAGENDLNRDWGNWWLANLELADAL